jgi:hypothetical protein
VNLDLTGKAQFGPISWGTAGTHTVEADYAGDGYTYNTSIGTLSPVQTVSVSGPPCSGILTNTAISAPDVNGAITLNFLGVAGIKYYVVASADASLPQASWTPLTWTTNTADPITGTWSCLVTNSAALQFYRATSVNPCH